MANSEIVNSSDIFQIVRRVLEIMNIKIMRHGEITAYILYKMLQTEGLYTQHELADYALIGILHDIGMIKTGYDDNIVNGETKGVWAHSIYGYLFLRYLSPMEERAEIVLYHHLPCNKYSSVKSKYIKISQYLNFSDKMDIFMRMKGHGMEDDYFTKYKDIIISSETILLFNHAQAKYHILECIRTGSYLTELNALFANAHFTTSYKKAILEMLIYSIDFRSQQTVLHTFATTTFAAEIGRLLGITEKEQQTLYYGALLHDIGKIAIPLDILEAPRKITEQEMRVMRAHVVISEQILKGVINEEILEIAIRHHEKLDGTGYHRKLTGKELTQLQRIVAVADILSALYGKRSYKDSFDPCTITNLLEQDAANGKLCPAVIAATLQNLNAITLKYEDIKEDTLKLYLTIMDQYNAVYEKFKKYE